jgi:CDP-glucose 4,6-dehydratase
MNSSFWKGKRVFITGHTGFKGSWLSIWLQHLGSVLTGYSLEPPTTPSLFELAKVSDGMNSVEGDVRDSDALKVSLLESKPEIVIHMAAQPLVRESYQRPVDTFETNILGTVNLFEAVRGCSSVQAVVNITTDKCYENKEWIWGYREHEAIGGRDPYSASKACAELVSSAYRESFFESEASRVALATARAGNVIGGGDWAKDRLMTDLIYAFTKGKPLQIRNPNAIRPWQHVLEPLRGYLMLAERLYDKGSSFAEAWNFGPKDEDVKPVSWLVEYLSKFWNDSTEWEIQLGDHPHEANHLKLDISKANSRLGWVPQINLEKALQMTAEWSIQLSRGDDARTTTMKQIISYQKNIQSLHGN